MNGRLLMKLRLYASVPEAIDLELEAEPGAVDDHLEGEVEVVELDAARGRKPGEQRPRDRAKVCRQRAHMHKLAVVGHRRFVSIACNQVVRHHEGLPGPEIARVVKRDGRERGDSFALMVR